MLAESLLIKYLAWVCLSLPQYNCPDKLPPIYFVPEKTLTNLMGRDTLYYALFISSKPGLILLNNNYQNKKAVNSIIIHELVHYVQLYNGKYKNRTPCNRINREVTAYLIQLRWLHNHNEQEPRAFALIQYQAYQLMCIQQHRNRGAW